MIRPVYVLTALALVTGQTTTRGVTSRVRTQDSSPTSPCPAIFSYENRSAEPGKWYGVINLTTDNTLYSLWLNVVLDSKADILGNWVGEVSTKDHLDFKVENTNMRILPGSDVPVRFFVQYNPSDKFPELKHIRLNGKEICTTETKSFERDQNQKLIYDRREETNTEEKAKFDTITNATVSWKPANLERSPQNANLKTHVESQHTIIKTGNNDNTSTTQKPYKWDTKVGTWSSTTANTDSTTRIDYVGLGSISTAQEKDKPFYSVIGTNTVKPSNSNNLNIVKSTNTESSTEFVGKDNGFDNKRTDSQSNFNIQKDSSSTHATRETTRFDVETIVSTPEKKQPELIQEIIDTYGPVYKKPESLKPTELFDVLTTGRPADNFHLNTRTTTTQRTTTSLLRKDDFEIDSEFDVDASKDDEDDYVGGIPTIYIPSSQDGSSSTSQKGQCGKVAISDSNPILDSYGLPTLEGQYPWQIALYKSHKSADNKYICAGTLVSRRHMVTAAHCVTRRGSRKLVNKNTLTLYLGKNNLRTSVEGVQIKFVDNIVIHPEYNETTLNRDLAILQLRDRITYTDHVRPVCLWPENLTSLSSITGKSGSLVGWGSEETGATKQELSLVKMPVIDKEACMRSYNAYIARIISEYSYCATYAEGTSSCNGDSGGGMVFRSKGTWYLRGVASLSVTRQNHYRCDPKHFVIFTDVAKFLPWIRNNVHDY